MKITSMAPLFTIIFVSKLLSNVVKNFCAIPWHQKLTVRCLRKCNFHLSTHNTDMMSMMRTSMMWFGAVSSLADEEKEEKEFITHKY